MWYFKKISGFLPANKDGYKSYMGNKIIQPKYQQMANYLADKIANQEYKEGDKIPSEVEIAEQFSASRMTARKAIDKLASNNQVRRVPGIGTFVRAPRAKSSLLQIVNLADEIAARGNIHRMQVLGMTSLHAADVPMFPQLESEHRIFKVIVLHTENDIPIQQEERYVSAEVAPDFHEQDFSKITTNKYLTSIAPLVEAEITVEAVNADNILCKNLQIDSGSACLKITRVTHSYNQVISCAVLYYPAERYTLTGVLKNL